MMKNETKKKIVPEICKELEEFGEGIERAVFIDRNIGRIAAAIIQNQHHYAMVTSAHHSVRHEKVAAESMRFAQALADVVIENHRKLERGE